MYNNFTSLLEWPTHSKPNKISINVINQYLFKFLKRNEERFPLPRGLSWNTIKFQPRVKRIVSFIKLWHHGKRISVKRHSMMKNLDHRQDFFFPLRWLCSTYLALAACTRFHRSQGDSSRGRNSCPRASSERSSALTCCPARCLIYRRNDYAHIFCVQFQVPRFVDEFHGIIYVQLIKNEKPRWKLDIEYQNEFCTLETFYIIQVHWKYTMFQVRKKWFYIKKSIWKIKSEIFKSSLSTVLNLKIYQLNLVNSGLHRSDQLIFYLRK